MTCICGRVEFQNVSPGIRRSREDRVKGKSIGFQLFVELRRRE